MKTGDKETQRRAQREALFLETKKPPARAKMSARKPAVSKSIPTLPVMDAAHEGSAQLPAKEDQPGFDRKAYQREYMKVWRARQKERK